MTDASYKQAQKLMRQINHLRGQITGAKNEVGRWTKTEMFHRDQLQHDKADGAKKCLIIAMQKLERLRNVYAAIKFPPNDLPEIQNISYCRICNERIQQIDEYCQTCYENQNIPKYDHKNRDNKEFFE
jgi:hypothetical protein